MSNHVSYNQLSMYNQCQKKYKLTYIDKLGTYSQSIHTIFGTSMHVVLQEYLNVLYNKSVKEAAELNLYQMLVDKMKEEFVKASDVEKKIYPCAKEDLMEFATDGYEIIDYFVAHRDEFFPKKSYKLLGCEIPLEVEVKNKVSFIGYIDIVIQDTKTNKVYIKDFKTSTSGWNDYQKKDESKTQQLVLYKQFYSDVFGIGPEYIDIEYIILKRKLYENAMYPQKRIQSFSPSNGTVSLKKVYTRLVSFIDECFDSDGNYKTDRHYEITTNPNACRFCEFNGTEHCDAPIFKK